MGHNKNYIDILGSVRTTAVWRELKEHVRTIGLHQPHLNKKGASLGYYPSVTVSYQSSLGGGRVDSTAKLINST